MAFRTNKMPVLQEKSASGSVASFNTALAMPLVSCNIAVNAWQEGSGDPSPSNVRPIHGFSEVNATRAGLNIKPNSGNTGTSHGVSVVYNSVDETYTLNGTGRGNILLGKYSNVDWKIGEMYRISVHVISGSFTLGSGGTSTTYAVGMFNDQGTAFIRGNVNLLESELESYTGAGTAFKSDGYYYLYFQLWRANTVFNDLKFKVQIEKNVGIATRPYVPYVTPTIYTIQLGQEVYGAEVDVDNGVAHVNSVIKKLTSADVPNGISQTYLGSIYYGTTSSAFPNALGKGVLRCNKLKYAGANLSGFTYGTCISLSSSYNFWIKDGDFVDSNEMLALLDELKLEVVYPLKTPFDIQLTPTQIQTLIGNNTIFADTGDVDLTYKDLDIAKRGNFREVFKLPS